MRTVRNCLILIAALIVLPAHAEDKPLALTGMDPVLLVQGVEEPGKQKFVASGDTYLYQFASRENREIFESNKSKFVIQNELCPVVPGAPAFKDFYAVHKGKIYAFATPNCVENFNRTPDAFL